MKDKDPLAPEEGPARQSGIDAALAARMRAARERANREEAARLAVMTPGERTADARSTHRALIEAGRRWRAELLAQAERDASRDSDAAALAATLRRSRTAAPRTRARGAGRPAARRVATRSSARSGDSGDDGPEPPAAPATAREAVARVYEDVLRRRHPGVSWEVVSS